MQFQCRSELASLRLTKYVYTHIFSESETRHILVIWGVMLVSLYYSLLNVACNAGNSSDKLCHLRSDAYLAEQVLLGIT